MPFYLSALAAPEKAVAKRAEKPAINDDDTSQGQRGAGNHLKRAVHSDASEGIKDP